MNIFVFDIETIPDLVHAKKIYQVEQLANDEAYHEICARRREKTNGSEFLPLHLQKIVAISVVLRMHDKFKVWSLGDLAATEAELITRFYDGLERYSPTLVSWNGSGFDLPVLHYRALLHGISAHRYWEVGEEDQSFRWNNYLSRYHYRHLDLMDVLAGYQSRANAPLNDIAIMLGLPGKMGIHGGDVYDYYQKGELETIRNYCETDVLNTYLVYLKFELMRGKITNEHYQREYQIVRDNLTQENKPHLTEFLNAWRQ